MRVTWSWASIALLSLCVQVSSSYDESWVDLPGSLYSPSEPWGFSIDASWPVSDIGQPIQPESPDAELQSMLAQVDVKRIKQIVTKLVGFGTRHTLSTQNSTTRGIGAARDWILREMRASAKPSNGSMDVYLNSYIQGIDSGRVPFPVNISNVVARINGSVDSNRTYVVTGHYDSRRIDILDYTNDAPGADDDATGVALVMELARICARKRPAATMIFAATAGEEQSLYGSAHLAQTLKNQSANVEGNWNNDIIGTGASAPHAPINNFTVRLFGASIFYPNASSAALARTTAIIGGWNDSPAQNLGRYIAEIAAGAARYVGMQVALVYRPDRFLRGGDHESFLAQGYPAVRFTEAVEDFAHQHQDPREQDGITYGDLIDFVDFDYVARVTKVNLASMWSAANAPGMPRNVVINTTVGSPAATEQTPLADIEQVSAFSWSSGTDPLVKGYELVWRPSGNLQWTHALWVPPAANGTTTSVRVELSKDNVQFGVRAVGKNGKKSPAVFPLPA